MKLMVLCIRDRAANVYGQPFFSMSVGVAIRSFQDEVNRSAPDNNLNKHPEDFDLYQLGSYDDNSGLFDTGQPVQVAVGKDMVRS